MLDGKASAVPPGDGRGLGEDVGSEENGEVCAAMDAAAAGLLADEALSAPALDVLRAALQRQPVWSDFPVILLTSSPRTTEARWQRVQGMGAVGNVTVLERPLTRVTLLSTIQVATAARASRINDTTMSTVRVLVTAGD